MSETKILGLFKHDDVETNENKFDIEKALNQNWDKIDEYEDKQDEEILKNKKDIENLETKRSKYYSNAITKRIEKIKNAKIYSAGSNLYNQTIYGESSQETREGYNLFNKYGDFSYSYGSATDSTSLQEDGTIISTSRISQLRSKGQLIKNLKSNTDYTVSGIILSKKERGKDNNFCLIDILPYENTTTIKRTYISNSENLPYKFKFTFNTGENTSIWISLNGMDTSNSESTIPVFDEIMIYEGTTDKEYQEYGTMPSLGFPSKVVSVGDNVNLFDGEYELGTINIETGQEQTQIRNVRTKNYIPIHQNSQYTYSSNYAQERWGIFYDKDKRYLSNLHILTKITDKVGTFTTPQDSYYMRWYIVDKDNINNLYDKLEEGSKATGYTSYGNGGIDYKITGKNIFNISKISNNAIITNNGDGTLTLQNCAQSVGFTYTNKTLKEICPDLKVGQNFIISFETNSSSIHKDKFYASTFLEKGIVYTATEIMLNANLVMYGGYNEVTTISNIQLEIVDSKESKATEYDPYKEFNTTIELPEGVELFSIDEYKDYIDENGIIHKNIKKHEFDGTENWGDYSGNNYAGYSLYWNTWENNKIIDRKGLCTHFVNNPDKVYAHNDAACWISPTALRVSLEKTIAEDVNQWKQFLADEKEKGTPVTVYCVLEEEDTSQKLAESQIEKLQNLKTFLGVTNITITAPLSASYNEDINYTLKEKDTRIEKLGSRIDELEKLIKAGGV